jgi:hypothetical protein
MKYVWSIKNGEGVEYYGADSFPTERMKEDVILFQLETDESVTVIFDNLIVFGTKFVLKGDGGKRLVFKRRVQKDYNVVGEEDGERSWFIVGFED